MIDKLANLTAGTYYMAGYLTESSGTGATVFTPYTYHLWIGTVNGGDCVTTNYQYESNQLTINPAATTGEAVTMELVAAGAANTYYIKIGDKYLKNGTSATNRKLTLVDVASGAEWVFSDFSTGGIVASNDGVSLGSANAASKILRSYKSADTLKYGLYFFKAN